MGKRVIVAGAGASGMMAGIWAARRGALVTLLEGTRKPGNKLLMTGNGRCNLTSLDPGLPGAYHSSERRGTAAGWPGTHTAPDVEEVFGRFGPAETIRFFEELGVRCTARETYVYPASGQAQTVHRALLAELSRLGVKMRNDTKVRGISRRDGIWMVDVDGWQYEADSVILACGGMSRPETGSDGSGYALAEMAGHTVRTPYPALTGLTLTRRDAAEMKAAAGARTQALIRLTEGEQMYPRTDAETYRREDGKEEQSGKYANEILLAEEVGELQWTGYGISGIAAFQLSTYAHRATESHPMNVWIDFVPDLERTELVRGLTETIRHFEGKISAADLAGGYTNGKIAACLAARAGFRGKETGTASAPENAERIAAELKRFRLHVSGTCGFDQAQVTGGGIPLEEICPQTMESVKAPGLYLAGEMIDIDGPCGGYNLQWAWTSGYTAGIHAAGKPSGALGKALEKP